MKISELNVFTFVENGFILVLLHTCGMYILYNIILFCVSGVLREMRLSSVTYKQESETLAASQHMMVGKTFYFYEKKGELKEI